MSFFQQWVRRRRRVAFDRGVERLLSERLGPELGVTSLGAPVRDKDHRRVYLPETNRGRAVIRFFHGRKGRRSVENCALAVERFQATGVEAPAVWLTDVTENGTSFIAQQYIEGEPFRRGVHDDCLPTLAGDLARVHGDLATTFGWLAFPEEGDVWREMLLPEAMRKVKRGGDDVDAARLKRWFERRLAERTAAVDQSSLLHGDLQPDNAIVTPDRRVVLMDFDRAVRAPYGVELIRLLLRFCLEPDEWVRDTDSIESFWDTLPDREHQILDRYFALAPDAFRADWKESRDLYLAWGMATRGPNCRALKMIAE